MMGADSYYSKTRSDFFQYLATNVDAVVLDLGCAEGYTGAALKRDGYASVVVGVDVHGPSVEVAKCHLDEVHCADLDTFPLGSLGEDRFDYIICGDVLEHLRDPWKVVRELRPLLKREGRLMITLPNTQHYSVSFPLLFGGEWRYREAGILDRTHLRFFTRKSMLRIFSPQQYSVVACRALFWGRRDPLINWVTFRAFEGLLTPQWTLILSPL